MLSMSLNFQTFKLSNFQTLRNWNINPFANLGHENGSAARGFRRFVAREHLLHGLSIYTYKSASKVRGKVQEVDIPLILPHELVHFFYMHHYQEFLSRFVGDLDRVEAYWHQSRGQSWLREHPGAHLVGRHPRRCLPLRLHGDEAPVTKKYGVLFLNFCSVMLRDQPSDLSRNLICALRNILINLEIVWEIIGWSFQVLLDGKMPSHDFEGNPLQGERGAMAGLPVAGDFYFLVTQIIGDWKWYYETFGMEHNFYNTFNFCWLCGADKSDGCHSGSDYREDAGWTQTLVDNQTFMSNRHELASCAWAGFHIMLLLLDVMHIVCLGTLHVDIGSCMWQMIQEGVWAEAGDPTTWKESCAMQLERAYLRFVEWASDTKTDHREDKWDRNKLSMTSTLSKPYWKGKAATNLAVARWLVHATREDMQKNPDNPKACHRANFWWGLISAINLWQGGPQFVSEEDARSLRLYRQTTLFSHRALQHLARRDCPDSLHWQPLPKHHLLDHVFRQSSDLSEDACRLNPCWFWAFTDEDFVGSCAKISKSQHARHKELRTLEMWHLKLAMLFE